MFKSIVCNYMNCIILNIIDLQALMILLQWLKSAILIEYQDGRRMRVQIGLVTQVITVSSVKVTWTAPFRPIAP